MVEAAPENAAIPGPFGDISHAMRERDVAEKRVKTAVALADKLDRLSERCAAKAPVAFDNESEWDLLARAATYQECAGLIREALK